MSGIFKRKRKREDKVVSPRIYYCRNNGNAVNLGLTDKQIAVILYGNLIKEHEREVWGLGVSKTARKALRKRTVNHWVTNFAWIFFWPGLSIGRFLRKSALLFWLGTIFSTAARAAWRRLRWYAARNIPS